MKTIAGIWIDHRRAVIAQTSDTGVHTLEIRSLADRQPGRSAGVRSTARFESREVATDATRERRFAAQLQRYYDLVIDAVRTAPVLLLFGPGEAKGELQKRLAQAGMVRRIAALETVDKLTDRQIAARVAVYAREAAEAADARRQDATAAGPRNPLQKTGMPTPPNEEAAHETQREPAEHAEPVAGR